MAYSGLTKQPVAVSTKAGLPPFGVDALLGRDHEKCFGPEKCRVTLENRTGFIAPIYNYGDIVGWMMGIIFDYCPKFGRAVITRTGFTRLQRISAVDFGEHVNLLFESLFPPTR